MLRFLRLLQLIACVTASAQAFDGPGHMQTADIAWTFLAGSAGAQAAIKAILKKARGQFKLTGNDAGKLRDAFDRAATFPDVIKGSTNSDYEPMIATMNLLFWSAAAISSSSPAARSSMASGMVPWNPRRSRMDSRSAAR